ncbi:MAG TPA: hypothetical protein PK351_06270 [Spirochaetota bacterium]|nr:hypothetical protein [Spirochaetota bacterium]HPP04416.1 hypothetical protein [Spirochaetota bacterium]
MDIFEVPAAPGLLVSERFKYIVEKYGLKNVWLIPAEKYGWDESRPGLWYILD